MAYREMNITITDVIGFVTDGTISIIQSATDESIKKRLVNRYCGRLSTLEASWVSALQEGSLILEAPDQYSGHWLSPIPKLRVIACFPDKNSSSASERNNRSVAAINKVLERYKQVRKRRLR